MRRRLPPQSLSENGISSFFSPPSLIFLLITRHYGARAVCSLDETMHGAETSSTVEKNQRPREIVLRECSSLRLLRRSRNLPGIYLFSGSGGELGVALADGFDVDFRLPGTQVHARLIRGDDPIPSA